MNTDLEGGEIVLELFYFTANGEIHINQKSNEERDHKFVCKYIISDIMWSAEPEPSQEGGGEVAAEGIYLDTKFEKKRKWFAF